jgi:hypothetical protein
VEARGLIQGLYFSMPQLLWAIPLLLVAGLIYMRVRGGSRLLLASRLIVFSLIILAAANPYFVETHTVRSVSPTITISTTRPVPWRCSTQTLLRALLRF